jgi:hypothetical protein
MNKEQIYELSRKSNHNKIELSKTEKCGCYFCIRVFDNSEIEEWVDADSDTALCPHCGIDSIVPGLTDVEVLTELCEASFTGIRNGKNKN